MDKKLILDCLHEEIVETTGCTDPGAVAYAVAKAASLIPSEPESVNVEVSNNVFKNGISVGIPGTSGTGLELAAALGVFLRAHSSRALSVMEYVDDTTYSRALGYLKSGAVSVRPIDPLPDPLYIRAFVSGAGEYAQVTIAHDYDCIIKTEINGKTLEEKAIPQDQDSSVDKLLKYPLKKIVEYAKTDDYEQFAFLLDYANVNLESLEKASRTLQRNQLIEKEDNLPMPFSMMHTAKENTFCLAKARMVGLKLPVIAVTGSGNHGITNFIGVMSVARSLGFENDREKIIRALTISTLVVIYIKGYIKRMTAFCGCTVAASTGVCAASVYLLDGNYEDTQRAINSLLCSLCGILCDGAKETCAYKLSTGVSAAIEYAWMSVKNGFGAPECSGIIRGSLEETFAAMGRINNPGMTDTDRVLVEIVSGR